MRSLDQLRNDLDTKLCKKFKNMKRIRPYSYEVKTHSGTKVELQFPQDEFIVTHDGVPTLRKKLASLTVDEILQYLSYKLAM